MLSSPGSFSARGCPRRNDVGSSRNMGDPQVLAHSCSRACRNAHLPQDLLTMQSSMPSLEEGHMEPKGGQKGAMGS